MPPGVADAVRRPVLRLLEQRRARSCCCPNPDYGGYAAAALGADRLHAGHPDPVGGRARRPRLGSTTCRSTTTADRSIVGGGSTALRTGGTRGATAPAPRHGAFLDYIVLNAGRPLFRDGDAACGELGARPSEARRLAFHDVPGDEIVPRVDPGVPRRDGLPGGPTRPHVPRAGSSAAPAGTPSSTTARCSRSATTA